MKASGGDPRGVSSQGQQGNDIPCLPLELELGSATQQPELIAARDEGRWHSFQLGHGQEQYVGQSMVQTITYCSQQHDLRRASTERIMDREFGVGLVLLCGVGDELDLAFFELSPELVRERVQVSNNHGGLEAKLQGDFGAAIGSDNQVVFPNKVDIGLIGLNIAMWILSILVLRQRLD